MQYPFAKPALRAFVGVVALTFLSACLEVSTPTSAPTVAPVAQVTPAPQSGAEITVASVVRRVEPVAEAECRKRTQGANCDFKIVVDTNPQAPANAYQSLDPNGRPVLTFTETLLKDMNNADELAFVLGHEAAHHIRGHLRKTRENATVAGVLGGVLATVIGADASGVEAAQNIGARVGVSGYSKTYELEADELGTVIAYRAGYDPILGAQYFTRIPDPGNRLFGSHPPNSKRVDIVYSTMEQLRSGG